MFDCCLADQSIVRLPVVHSVRISALALLKMAMHAKSGGNLEIMGMLQGKVHQDTFIVIDVFALPVEGTETRVNAQAEAYEYIVDFAETGKVSLYLPAVVPAPSHLPAGSVRPKPAWMPAESGSAGKHDWLVSQSPWLWMLAVRY